jgi:glycosyltransferase involved in cell wall biosynthesis
VTGAAGLGGQRVCLVVTEDWYFVGHWLPAARALRDAGAAVAVVTRVRDHGTAIEAAGVELLPWRLERRSARPWTEARSFLELRAWYRAWRPTVVQHVGLKPILYGALAAATTGRTAILSVFAGLGSSFIGRRWSRRAWRALLRPALRAAVNRPGALVVVQNQDDADLLASQRIVRPGRTRVLPGHGVDLDRFHPLPEPGGPPLVVYAGRLIREKGVTEFVAAARQLRRDGVAARFALVGASDPGNPGAVAAGRLGRWQAEGIVEVWGRREDMPAVLGSAAVVCLPSYREGLPMLLAEAAAAGRPVVATDVPGCRDVVRHGETGLLVPPADAPALADAIRRLLADAGLRVAMGRAARELAEARFSRQAAAERLLRVYHELAAGPAVAGRPTPTPGRNP